AGRGNEPGTGTNNLRRQPCCTSPRAMTIALPPPAFGPVSGPRRSSAKSWVTTGDPGPGAEARAPAGGQRPRPAVFFRPLVYQRGCRSFKPEEGVRLPHGRLAEPGTRSVPYEVQVLAAALRSLKPGVRVQVPRASLNRGVV